MVDKLKATPTGTKARYTQGVTKLVASSLGVGTNPDGTPQSLSDPGIEIVHIDRIYPDSMTALVTYRETTDSKPIQETVMILSPMIDDNSKMLWLPPGKDQVDSTTGHKFRVPSQTNLTGIILNINADSEDEKILIGYIRMKGESKIIDGTEFILEPTNPLITLFNGKTFDFKIGNTEVLFDNDHVHIDTPEFLVNGKPIEEKVRTSAPLTGTWMRGQKIYNPEPNGGGYVGWICISGGTPGTWKRFGLIEN